MKSYYLNTEPSKTLCLALTALVAAIIATLIQSQHSQAQIIDSNIPSGIPTYIDGAPDKEANWENIYNQMMTETECVDLNVVGICNYSDILWSYRLPVQIIETVRNAGETMLEDPSDVADQYSDYTQFYSDVQSYVQSRTGQATSQILFALNQQRRTGLKVAGQSGVSFGQSHVYSTPDDYVPYILSFLPDNCKTWDEYEPFKTDVYPNQVLWRFPEFTADALPGAEDVTPADCANYNMTTGQSDPGLINVQGGGNILMSALTCASAWGGKVYPLNGHSNHTNDYVGDALRAVKAINLGPYALQDLRYSGAMTHQFDVTEDALKDAYNGSGCIKFGDKDSNYGSKFPREVEGKEVITHYIHWKRVYCCY